MSVEVVVSTEECCDEVSENEEEEEAVVSRECLTFLLLFVLPCGHSTEFPRIGSSVPLKRIK